jgi:hypothetical protein
MPTGGSSHFAPVATQRRPTYATVCPQLADSLKVLDPKGRLESGHSGLQDLRRHAAMCYISASSFHSSWALRERDHEAAEIYHPNR